METAADLLAQDVIPDEIPGLFKHVLNAVAYVRIIYADGVPCDWEYLRTNPSYHEQTGLGVVVGRRATELMPKLNTYWQDAVLRIAAVAEGGPADTFDSFIPTFGQWMRLRVFSPKIGFAVLVFDLLTNDEVVEHNRLIATATFESSDSQLVLTGSGVIIRANLAFYESSGFSVNEVIGNDPSFLQSSLTREMQDDQVWANALTPEGWSGDIWNRAKNGVPFLVRLTVKPVIDSAGVITHFVATLQNPTSTAAVEAAASAHKYYDVLTGLPNAILLKERLQAVIGEVDFSSNSAAVVVVDIDSFRVFNTAHGVALADEVLKGVGLLIRQVVRQDDMVARLAGDSFAILISGLGAYASCARKVEGIVQKIRSELEGGLFLAGEARRVTVSSGIVVIQSKGADPDDLMHCADLALSRAKTGGGNSWRIFTQDMVRSVAERASLERDLSDAVDANQLLLHYQPQVVEGTIVGAEALLRWLHPVRGFVSPADFIPVAEENGLILRMGEKVIETACEVLARWSQDTSLANLTLSVNISASQLQRADFVGRVRTIIDGPGVNPHLASSNLKCNSD